MDSLIENYKSEVGRLPTPEELGKIARVTKGSAFIALEEYNKKVRDTVEEISLTNKSDKRKNISVLSALLFAISLVTYLLSLYFTGLWFNTMFNIVIAYSISFAMVTYMVIAPSLLRKGYYILLGITFIVALVFSMGSTVAGQYNSMLNSVDEVKTNTTKIFELVEVKEMELVKYISELKELRKVHENTIITLSEDRIKNQIYISTERNKITEYNELIEVQNELLKGVRDQKEELLIEGVEVAPSDDFYTILSKLFNIDLRDITFIIHVLPAVFIDIISSLCFNLAIRSLKDEKA